MSYILTLLVRQAYLFDYPFVPSYICLSKSSYGHQGGVLSPTLFNIYTADIPPPRAPVQVMAYADDITSTHTSTSAAKKYIQPYLHTVFSWTKQNNLTLNPDKTTCTLFTAEYKSNLALKINNTALRMATHPKVLGLTLDPHSQHLSTSTQATTNDKCTHSNKMG